MKWRRLVGQRCLYVSEFWTEEASKGKCEVYLLRNTNGTGHTTTPGQRRQGLPPVRHRWHHALLTSRMRTQRQGPLAALMALQLF